ncbi:hypothetical protein [Sphaerisporangium aureirubrum]|uniref:WD40 repeat domain-containing protein n=1 Tax=Sphaerisporangium aureirubrum TaxID=1544736 RepID=A0ABW1N875_9ACTN
MKGLVSRPCGSWKLTLRNGKTVTLGDATVFPRLPNGKVDKGSNAPLAISGDGSRVVYFRKSDRKLVWKNVAGGSSRAFPGKAAKVPKGLGMGDLSIKLSREGDRVAIDYGDADGSLPSLLVDLRGGGMAQLPGFDTVQGFSPDGTHVLTTNFTEDNTTGFTVYDTEGNPGEDRVVPQVASNNSPIALADDQVTVGLVITPLTGVGKPRLRQYDLSTDAISPALELNLPAGEMPYRLYWDENGKLVVWGVRGNLSGLADRATARRVDPSTGELTKIDSFRMKPDVWTWWLPGE